MITRALGIVFGIGLLAPLIVHAQAGERGQPPPLPPQATDEPPPPPAEETPSFDEPPPTAPTFKEIGGGEADVPQRTPRSHGAESATARTEEPPPIADDAPRRDPADLGDFGVGLQLGLAGGGDDLLSVEFDDGTDATLSAGTGVSMSLVVQWIPLHFDLLHLGVSADIGFKYAGIEADNGSIGFIRFPTVVAARSYLRLSGPWHLMFAGGLQYDMAPELSGDGVFDGTVEFDSAAGYMLEGGVHYEAGDRSAIDVTLRYVDIEYDFSDADATVDGGCVGVFGTVAFVP